MQNVDSSHSTDHPRSTLSSIALAVERIAWGLFFLTFPFGNTIVGFALLLPAAVLGWIGRTRPAWPFDPDTIEWKDPFHVSAILFLFAIGIAAIFATDKLLAVYILIAFLLLYYLAICGAARVIKGYMAGFVQRLVPWVLLASSVGSAYALYTYLYLKRSRAIGLLVTPNGLGMISGFMLIISIGYLLKIRESRSRFWPIVLIAIGLQLGALIVSFSRGSWLASMAALFVLCLQLLLQSKKLKPVLALLLVTLLVGGLVLSQSEPVRRRFVSSFSVASNQDRIRVWSAAVNMIKANPWVGVGGGNFPVVYSEYKTENGRARSMAFAHNMPLHIAAEFGVLGLLPFAAMIWIALKRGWRLAGRGDPLVKALFAAYVGMIVHDMVDNITYGMAIGAMFWFITGVWAASIEGKSRRDVHVGS